MEPSRTGDGAPVFVSDERRRDTSIPLLVAAFIFGATAISVFKFGLTPLTSIQVQVLIVLGCVFLVFGLYTFLTSYRIEFYENYIRLMSRKSGHRNIPYDQLRFEIVQVRGRTGIIELGRLSVEGQGRFRLTMSDVKIPQLNTTSFQWLQTKVGQAHGKA